MFIYSITLTKEKTVICLLLVLLLLFALGAGISVFRHDTAFTDSARRRYLVEQGFQPLSDRALKHRFSLPEENASLYNKADTLLPLAGKTVRIFTYRNASSDSDICYLHLAIHRGRILACIPSESPLLGSAEEPIQN